MRFFLSTAKCLLGVVWFLNILLLWVAGLLLWVPACYLFRSLRLIACIFSRAKSTTATTTPASPTHNAAQQQPDPECATHRVAIVGAGWTGIHLTKLLTERGMSVQVFEQLDDLGGTWHPEMSYQGLYLHSATWSNEFPGFAYPDKSKINAKLSASEMQQYIRSFAAHHNVIPRIRFNTTVTKLRHHIGERTATVTVLDNNTGQISEIPGFDLVVVATFCVVPKFPEFKNRDAFRGRIVHSAHVKGSLVAELVGTSYQRRPSRVTNHDMPQTSNTKRNKSTATLNADGLAIPQPNQGNVVPVSSRSSESSLPAHAFWAKEDLTTPPPDVTAKDLKPPPKVVVLGGSKSATDVVCMLHSTAEKNSHPLNLTWVYRKCYHFVRYESLNHNSSPVGILRGFCFLLCMPVVLLCPSLLCLFNLINGYYLWPREFHLDMRRFHLGILDKKQARLIRELGSVRGEVERLTETGLRLQDGRDIDADIIICATGYTTGVARIAVEVVDANGCAKELELNQTLFHHLFVPECPVLAVTATAPTHFGPVRGITLADHIVWYLNQTNLSPTMMRLTANKHLLHQTPHQSVIFDHKQVVLAAWLLSLLDLVLVGMVSPWHVFSTSLKSFGFGRLEPLRLVPPKRR